MARVKKKTKITRSLDTSKNWMKYLLAIAAVIIVIALLNLKPEVKSDSQEIEITNKVKVPSVTIALQQSSSPVSKEVQSDPLDDSTQQTANNLVNQYFESQKSSDVAYNERLDDYSVTSVSGRKTDSQLLINITYSVKPSVLSSFWSAGNGTMTSDGWVRNKYGCTVVNKVDGQYAPIEGIATGCAFTQ